MFITVVCCETPQLRREMHINQVDQCHPFIWIIYVRKREKHRNDACWKLEEMLVRVQWAHPLRQHDILSQKTLPLADSDKISLKKHTIAAPSADTVQAKARASLFKALNSKTENQKSGLNSYLIFHFIQLTKSREAIILCL
jgi:hypothetical protein